MFSINNETKFQLSDELSQHKHSQLLCFAQQNPAGLIRSSIGSDIRCHSNIKIQFFLIAPQVCAWFLNHNSKKHPHKSQKKHWLKSKHTFIIIRSFNIFCIFLDVMKCDENHSNQQFIHLAKDPANVCCVWIAVLFLPWPRLFCKRHLYLSETSWYNKGEMR